MTNVISSKNSAPEGIRINRFAMMNNKRPKNVLQGRKSNAKFSLDFLATISP